ncbi:hypothetical protein GGR57DRAFT_298627 [Xylariaceae sp. FL1272]|nr:hypothetical protein GGR57DRAFT_298627 [Xylariaceae sp. FL1272]
MDFMMSRARVEHPRLMHAIESSDAVTLRHLITAMCMQSEVCRGEVENRMLARKRHIVEFVELSNSEDCSEDGSDADSEEDRGPPKKKKAKIATTDTTSDDSELLPRFEKCKTCKETFDVTKNHKRACRTHDGQLDIDPDVFPDDDQVMYDPHSIDPHTDWRRDEWPEGFIWDCCDEDCTSEGCVVQGHIPITELRGF